MTSRLEFLLHDTPPWQTVPTQCEPQETLPSYYCSCQVLVIATRTAADTASSPQGQSSGTCMETSRLHMVTSSTLLQGQTHCFKIQTEEVTHIGAASLVCAYLPGMCILHRTLLSRRAMTYAPISTCIQLFFNNWSLWLVKSTALEREANCKAVK